MSKSLRYCITEDFSSPNVIGLTPHCRLHGGGFPCRAPGCQISSISGGDKPHYFCYKHGGGRLCTIAGFETAARGQGLCRSHGGGKRCREGECETETPAQGGSDLCNKHGGGSRCEIPFCSTTTYQNKTLRCKKHTDTDWGILGITTGLEVLAELMTPLVASCARGARWRLRQ